MQMNAYSRCIGIVGQVCEVQPLDCLGDRPVAAAAQARSGCKQHVVSKVLNITWFYGCVM
jgi:hypothetical protein